ncbi:hypothetical protein DUNSADRAFT_15747 [Dunaliella salina]|uniref:Uncharacterized protein n=1 Tax=Dunaliella salina TaxID=3046 RepID=A0ABQ7H9C2_DUNSA|nr:hypothetical protein DUNSADRAFT_15747 [Dunaliella salina]|eukprot:KAF5843452.1 hypothetical protein DUNSADRAFT_15747 [Dunaliella salina]
MISVCISGACACWRKVAAYKELAQRLERKELLSRTANRLALQKEVAGKGRKRKLGKDELARTGTEEGQQQQQQGPVFRWKRERKK